MKTAMDAIDLSDELIREWLSDVMLKDDKDNLNRAVTFLGSHENSKVHGRHYQHSECIKNGLKIKLMEDDNTLQDLILSVHHSFMITFQQTSAVKIISNDQNKSFIFSVGGKQ